MLAGHALRRNTARTEAETSVAGADASVAGADAEAQTSPEKSPEMPPGEESTSISTSTSTSKEAAQAAAAAEATAATTAHHIDELLQLFPSLQHGMDVNPKFTLGPTGCEYTSGLGAFDIMGVDLVHGWLVDIDQEPEVASVIGSNSYNQLVEMQIKGNEAMENADKLTRKINDLLSDEGADDVTNVNKDAENGGTIEEKSTNGDEEEEKMEIQPVKNIHQSQKEKERELDNIQQELSRQNDIAHQGTIVRQFLDTTSHQLTYTGLMELHSHVQEGRMCVFFRNNHFATLTKHEGTLYLLVTDLGYAGVKEVVWEKLDDISGDTDLYDGTFCRSQVTNIHPVANGHSLSPEQLLAQRGQSDADYQLALELSRNDQGGTSNTLAQREGDLVAAATELSLREYNNSPRGNGTVVDIPRLGGNVENQTITENSNGDQQLSGLQTISDEERDRRLAMQLQQDLDAADNREAQRQQQQARENANTNQGIQRQRQQQARGNIYTNQEIQAQEMRRRRTARESPSSGCYIC